MRWTIHVSYCFFLLLWTIVVVVSDDESSGGEPPVCLASSQQQQQQQQHCAPAATSNRQTNERQQGLPPPPPPTCGLYLATSSSPKFTLYAGVSYAAGDTIGSSGDLVIPVVDVNKNEWSPWQDVFWHSSLLPTLQEGDYLQSLFVPGVGSLVSCHGDNDNDDDDDNNDNDGVVPNIQATPTSVLSDSLGAHRSKMDATAGSFAYHSNYSYTAIRPIQPGQELIVSCYTSNAQQETINQEKGDTAEDHHVRSMEWLHDNAVCLDTLTVGPSTLPGTVGRGAFSKFDVTTGSPIATTPVLHFDRSQLQMVQQEYYQNKKQQATATTTSTSSGSTTDEPFVLSDNMIRDHGIRYSDTVIGQQLLLNYCFGTKESNVLLLPLGPGVNFINHSREKTNAYIRWSYDNVLTTYPNYLQTLSVHELLDEVTLNPESQLVLEIVAMKDIQAGDEIFLDYGDDWVNAWEEHVANWKAHETESPYQSANEYSMRNHPPEELIRTVTEQIKTPYPENIQTACYVEQQEEEEEDVNDEKSLEWKPNGHACLRPCDILERHTQTGNVLYTATVYSKPGYKEEPICRDLPEGGVKVTYIPSNAITLIDKPYTTDMHLHNSFRHEMGVPETLFPHNWMTKDPKEHGDFIPTPLQPGELATIRWADTGEIVTPNAHRLGLNPKVRQVLLEYCNAMGITELFRHVTKRGNALRPGYESYLTLDGDQQWYLQRPEKKWQSNLQWLSPGDNPSHENYLQALSVAGFDDMLAGIGEALGLETLVAFHVTFIAVSHSTKGYMHHDVTETGAKAFNVIIPLLLANETGPELDLMNSMDEEYDYEDDDEDQYRVGRYRYEYDVASMMGDDSYHASSAVDYRTSKEMRMAATVYIADVDEDNVEEILSQYTQAYPPDDPDLLLSWRGRHWRRDDPSVKLPKPTQDHILVRNGIASRSESTATSVKK